MDYTERVPLPAWPDVNSGLTCPNPRFMIDAVGNPRSTYSNTCQPPTNPAFTKHLATVDIGPFTVQGHHLFLRALRSGFDTLKVSHPDLIALIGTAGLLCCRYIRGYHVISNHSFGCAIDIKVGGVMPPLGADWCTRGHLLIYEAMHAEKIYWGGGYHHRPDGMHYEASEQLVTSWDGAT